MRQSGPTGGAWAKDQRKVLASQLFVHSLHPEPALLSPELLKQTRDVKGSGCRSGVAGMTKDRD